MWITYNERLIANLGSEFFIFGTVFWNLAAEGGQPQKGVDSRYRQ